MAHPTTTPDPDFTVAAARKTLRDDKPSTEYNGVGDTMLPVRNMGEVVASDPGDWYHDRENDRLIHECGVWLHWAEAVNLDAAPAQSQYSGTVTLKRTGPDGATITLDSREWSGGLNQRPTGGVEAWAVAQAVAQE